MTLPLLLRSVLYVPGSNAKVLAKAPGLGADALILDLEDSVAPEAKVLARELVASHLRAPGHGAPFTTVRLNALTSGLWQEDLAVVLPARPDALVIPKVERAEELAPLLDALERMDAPGVPIMPMIESPRGVLNALAIASQPRVAALVMGTSDLAKAIKPRFSGPRREPLHTALHLVILAARAAEVAVIDGVFLDIKDPDGFAEQCREGAEMGFDGKTVIHPNQVALANQAFLPSEHEVAQARRILEAWQAARQQGEEICVVDGRLVERLHASEAERLLAIAQQAIQESLT